MKRVENIKRLFWIFLYWLSSLTWVEIDKRGCFSPLCIVVSSAHYWAVKVRSSNFVFGSLLRALLCLFWAAKKSLAEHTLCWKATAVDALWEKRQTIILRGSVAVEIGVFFLSGSRFCISNGAQRRDFVNSGQMIEKDLNDVDQLCLTSKSSRFRPITCCHNRCPETFHLHRLFRGWLIARIVSCLLSKAESTHQYLMRPGCW